LVSAETLPSRATCAACAPRKAVAITCRRKTFGVRVVQLFFFFFITLKPRVE